MIGTAGVLKLPDLMGSAGDGVRPNRLSPFGVYCIAMGLFCVLVFSL